MCRSLQNHSSTNLPSVHLPAILPAELLLTSLPPKPLIISEKNGVRKSVENPMLGGGGNRTRGRQAHKRGEFSSQPSAGKRPAPPEEKTGIYSTTWGLPVFGWLSLLVARR